MRPATALVFLILLACSVSGQVHASVSNLIDQPKNCFKKLAEESFCAVFASENSKINLGDSVLFVKKSTSLILHGVGRFELLSGVVLLQKKGTAALEVKMLQEGLRIQSGELLLSRSGQQSPVEIVNLKAQVDFFGLWTATQALPPGYQNWFAPGLQKPGYGVPRIYDSEVVFRQVTALWLGPTKEVVEVLKSYGELRRSAHLVAAESYQGLVQRHFASIEEERLQEVRRQKASAAERDKLRRLYRARVLEGEYTQPFD